MRYLYVILLFLFSLTASFSQYGVSAKYQINKNSIWNDISQDQSSTSTQLFKNSIDLGINYWFRLKNQRIEFLPEIAYTKASDSNLINTQAMIETSRTSIGFNMHTQIYPFDFNNDCNCPTFSKDGTFITKGFFWLVSPGISMNKIESEYLALVGSLPEMVNHTTENQIVGKLGLGAGLDFGIMDVITLSPFVLYSVSFGHKWNQLQQIYDLDETVETSSNISQLNFGLRLMFRPDYVRKNR